MFFKRFFSRGKLRVKRTYQKGVVLAFLQIPSIGVLSNCKKSPKLSRISLDNITSLESSSANGASDLILKPKVRNTGAMHIDGRIAVTCEVHGENNAKQTSAYNFVSLSPGESQEIAPITVQNVAINKEYRYVCELKPSEQTGQEVLDKAVFEGIYRPN